MPLVTYVKSKRKLLARPESLRFGKPSLLYGFGDCRDLTVCSSFRHLIRAKNGSDAFGTGGSVGEEIVRVSCACEGNGVLEYIGYGAC